MAVSKLSVVSFESASKVVQVYEQLSLKMSQDKKFGNHSDVEVILAASRACRKLMQTWIMLDCNGERELN